MTQSLRVLSTGCGPANGVYIKLVNVKHSTNKLRIVNVNSPKSGHKFSFSHTRAPLLGVERVIFAIFFLS